MNSSDAGSSYDADRDILAAATSLIPLLWLSIFEESDLQHVVEDGNRIPAMLTTVQLAKDRLKARQAILKRALPENTKQLTEWKKLISKIPHKFVTVDGLEVWGLDPESYEASLVPAVRWFSSNAADDLEALQSLSETQSQLRRKSIKFPWHSKHNLHGHKWVREVPWDDADDEPPSRASAPVGPAFEPIDPALLERHQQLQIFWELDWLSHAGEPLRPDWAGTGDGEW
ncbi:MAG: hypothetical protein JNL18_22245 [Planctomycetaceae bacterium]|nr:hypothetical protein [Planctomycetaceae bacterium]